MVITSRENSIGAWAFLLGVVLAIIIGLLLGALASIPFIERYSTEAYLLLAFLGVVTGAMIRIGNDSQTFLIAGIIIVIASSFGMQSVTGTLIGIDIRDAIRSIFASLLALFVPATIIVALKTVFSRVKI